MGRRKPLMIAGYGLSNLIKPLFALSGTWGQAFGPLVTFGIGAVCAFLVSILMVVFRI